MHLRDARTFLRAQRRAAQRGKIFEAAFIFLSRVLRRVERQIAIVDRLERAALVLFNVATTNDPFAVILAIGTKKKKK